MGLTDSFGLPIAVDATSASPHEVTLVDDTLDACFLENVPEKVIGDKAYDSDKLDKRMAEPCGDIESDGRLNACLPGCKTFVVLSFVMNTILKTFLP